MGFFDGLRREKNAEGTINNQHEDTTQQERAVNEVAQDASFEKVQPAPSSYRN